MGKEYLYPSQWGKTYTLRFVQGSYADNGTLAVIAYCYEDQMWQPYANITVNLGDPEPRLRGENFAFVDDNNLPRIAEWLEKNGIAHIVEDGYLGRSGFCTYPLVEFDKAFLSETPLD